MTKKREKPEPLTMAGAAELANRIVVEMIKHARVEWDRELDQRVHKMVREHMEYIGRTARTDNEALAARLLDAERVAETYALVAAACEKMRKVMERSLPARCD